MEEVVPFLKRKANSKDVNIKIVAAPTVTLLKKDVAPEPPNTVWLEPPNAAPISAPLPVWSNTIRIKAIHTIM
jgi:hypothetical protein